MTTICSLILRFYLGEHTVCRMLFLHSGEWLEWQHHVFERRSPGEVEANGVSQGTVLTLAPFCKSFAPAANNDLGGRRLQVRLLNIC